MERACRVGRDGGGRMRSCHSLLFTQHKIAGLQMDKERLRLFIPHVPATLRPMALISLRRKYNITFLVLLHLCESEQRDIPEKSQEILISSSLSSALLISFFIWNTLFCFSWVNSTCLYLLGLTLLSSFLYLFLQRQQTYRKDPEWAEITHVHIDSKVASFWWAALSDAAPGRGRQL